MWGHAFGVSDGAACKKLPFLLRGATSRSLLCGTVSMGRRRSRDVCCAGAGAGEQLWGLTAYATIGLLSALPDSGVPISLSHSFGRSTREINALRARMGEDVEARE
jgi:hypothetical protein